MQSITIGGTTVERGKAGIGFIKVATMPRGDVLQIPIHIVNGAYEGPTLGLACTSHGDEAYGILIIREVLKRIDPGTLHGNLLAIPVLNPIAFEDGLRLTGVSQVTNETNLNTVFPGDNEGSLVARMAYWIKEEFAEKLDCLLDFHCSGVDGDIDYTLAKACDGKLGQEIQALAKAYGSPIVQYYTEHGIGMNPATSLTDVVIDRGKPALAPMCGGGLTYLLKPEALNRAVEGVLNVMNYLQMAENEVALPCQEQIIVGRKKVVRFREGGYFIPAVGIDMTGSTVAEGTLLGQVISPYTLEVLEEVRAPFEPTVLIHVRACLTRVAPGDYAYILGGEIA